MIISLPSCCICHGKKQHKLEKLSMCKKSGTYAESNHGVFNGKRTHIEIFHGNYMVGEQKIKTYHGRSIRKICHLRIYIAKTQVKMLSR
jgi:hypothetical protein